MPQMHQAAFVLAIGVCSVGLGQPFDLGEELGVAPLEVVGDFARPLHGGPVDDRGAPLVLPLVPLE